MSFLPDLKAIIYSLAVLGLCMIGAAFYGHYEFDKGEQQELLIKDKVTLQTDIKAEDLGSSLAEHFQAQLVAIQGPTITITKQVPTYVTKADDKKCVVNNGFVSVWNAANKMQPPASATSSAEQPSNVVLSDIAAQHTREASVCTATEAQRDSLKSYILGLQQLYK